MKFISGKDKKNHAKIHNINEEKTSPKIKHSYQTSELTDSCQQPETQIINMEMNNSSDMFILNPSSMKINSKEDCFSYNLHENKEEIPKNSNEAFTIETTNKMHCPYDNQNIF